MISAIAFSRAFELLFITAMAINGSWWVEMD
jgi:hypothetical protein